MVPYPDTFPAHEVAVLLPILRGKVPPGSEAVHAGWVVVGFGLSQILPVDGEVKSLSLTGSEVANLLDVEVGTAAAVPWDKIIAFLLPLILEWLSKKIGQS